MKNKSLFGGVLCATIVPAILFSGLIPVYSEQLTAQYGITREELGRALMVLMVTFGPVGLLGGWLAARFGTLRVLVASQAAFGAGLLLYGIRPELGPVMVLGVLATMTGRAFVLISNKVAVDLMPEEKRNRGTNLLHGVNATGKVVGPLVAGVFAGGLWRLGFGASAALPLVLAVWIWLAGKEYHASERAEGSGAAREVLLSPVFWLAVSGFAFMSGAEACANFALPDYLKTLGYDDSEKGYLTACFTGGIVAGRFVVAVLLTRVPPRFLVYGCGLFAGFLGLVGGGWWLATAAVLVLGGLTFSTAWPSYFAYLCRYFPRHKAYLAGVSGLATVAGIGGSLWLSGYLADRYEPGMSVTAGAVIFGAWLAGVMVAEMLLDRRREETRSKDA